MSARRMGKKKEVLREVFLHAKRKAKNKDFIVFNNNLVRKYAVKYGFGNQFDVVKHNTQATLPEEMVDESYFIIHLGRGKHAFIRGSKCGFNGFHLFENIPMKNRIKWRYNPSLMDRLSMSESQTISTVFNDRIIHDFMFGNKDDRILYHAGRRARVSFTAEACPGLEFDAHSLQLEVDAFFEMPETDDKPPILATVEGKKTSASEFEVRQLFTVMQYLHKGVEDGLLPKNTEIHNLYVVSDSPESKSVEWWYHIRIYDYYFQNPRVMSSIKLRKAKEYQLDYQNQ